MARAGAVVSALVAVCACGGSGDGDGGADAADGAVDAGTDARRPPRDAGLDAVDDDAGDGCDLYGPCSPDRGCRTGECVRRGIDDYECVPVPPTGPMPAPCVIGDSGGVCGECGICLGAGTTAAGEQVTVCARECTRSLDDNGECRDGYGCSLTTGACLPGCEPGPGGDLECGGRCDPDSFRCRSPGTPGAEAGDPCTLDSHCEADGTCIPWPDGYCTKFACDLTGNECAGAGLCQERRIGISICLAPCTVAQAYVDDPTTTAVDWIDGTDPAVRGGCREGYACEWAGVLGAGEAGNGGCLPGVFNDVATSNVGTPCSDPDGDGPLDASSVCYSPFGHGFCSALAGGTCVVGDCAAPGMPPDVAGLSARGRPNVCVDADGTSGDFTVGLEECQRPDDCTAPTLGCMAFPTPTSPTVCIGCTEAAHCRGGYRCTGTATTLGDCEAPP